MAVPMKLTHLDTGAPVLTGEDGAMYSLLKWALPQLGWTIEHDDAANFRIAFRNSDADGLGGFLQIYDQAADHLGNAGRARVRLFSTMSDVNTGADESPTSDNAYIIKSGLADTTVRRWEIYGDDRTFMLFTNVADQDNDNTWHHCIIGNLEPRKSTDNTFMFAGSDENDSSVIGGFGENSNPYPTNPGTHVTFLFSHDGVNSNREGKAYTVSTGGQADASSDVGIESRLTDPVTNQSEFCRAYFYDSDDNVRGYIRGVFWPLGDWVSTHGSLVDMSDLPHPGGTRTMRLWVCPDRTNNDSIFSFAALYDLTGDWDD